MKNASTILLLFLLSAVALGQTSTPTDTRKQEHYPCDAKHVGEQLGSYFCRMAAEYMGNYAWLDSEGYGNAFSITAYQAWHHLQNYSEDESDPTNIRLSVEPGPITEHPESPLESRIRALEERVEKPEQQECKAQAEDFTGRKAIPFAVTVFCTISKPDGPK